MYACKSWGHMLDNYRLSWRHDLCADTGNGPNESISLMKLLNPAPLENASTRNWYNGRFYKVHREREREKRSQKRTGKIREKRRRKKEKKIEKYIYGYSR